MSHPVTPLRLTLFGAPQIMRADGTAVALRSRKHLALLIYLAVEQRRPASRDTVLALLWPDAGEETARNNLRVALADLRRAVGAATDQVLHATRHTVQFNPNPDHVVDVLQFRTLLHATEQHGHDALLTCAACLAHLEQAAALYRGEFLAGFVLPDSSAWDEWAFVEREQLHQAALQTLDTLATAAEQQGDYAQQCRSARRQIALEPWREGAHVQLMRGLWLSGQRGAALEQYAVCARILRDELGIAPDAATTALYETIKAGTAPAPATQQPASHPGVERAVPVPAAAPFTNLPTPLTPCIGRDQELADLVALAQSPDVRLLTLVGVGGIGKTHLSWELGRARGHEFADGVWFVPLAPLQTPSAIAPAILAALGVAVARGDPHTVLLQVLRTKRMLLILDNVEHLVDGAAIVSDILEGAPLVEIIATSRERLNLRGEYPYLLHGLAYAPQATLAQATDAAAVRVFVLNAKRVDRSFKLDEHNVAAVLRICALVDGLPLGLELAAAWVEALSPAEIAREIEQSVDFLQVEWGDLPERQRSLRAVFVWSWQLLTEAERRVLRGSAVLRGGCTREAAQAVLDAPLRVLTSLTHKSMLRWGDAAGGVGRYDMHELVRQFAAEQLAAVPDERAAVEARHAAYYLHFVAERDVRLARHEPQQAAAEIRAEIDNIRQAWVWAATHAAVELLDTSAWGFWQYHKLTGVTPEAEHVWRLAAESVQAQREYTRAGDRHHTERVVSKLRALHAFALHDRGAYAQSSAVASAAISLAQASGSVEAEVIGCFVRGAVHYRQGHYVESRAELERTLELLRADTRAEPAYESLGVIEWLAHIVLAANSFRLGDYNATTHHCQIALHLCRTQGRRFGEAFSWCGLADVAREVRDLPSARRSYEQALRLSISVGYRRGEGQCQLDLGDVLRLQGEYTLALDATERALATLREIGDVLETARAAAYLGRLYSYLGAYARAHESFAEFGHNASIAGSPEMVVDGLRPRATLSLQTGNAEQALADAEQAWTLAQAFGTPYAQAATLIVLGRAQAALQLPTAAESYEQALAAYERLGNPALAAEARAGLAALARTHGDHATALAHTEAILRVLAEYPRAGLDEPFDIYLTCYRVLAAHADPRANGVLHAARNLLDRYADHITDHTLRQSFLNNVATHRELLHECHPSGDRLPAG